jgi:hypothetical protein
VLNSVPLRLGRNGTLVRARRWDYGGCAVPPLDPDDTAVWDLTYAYGAGGRTRTSATDSGGRVFHTVDVFDTLRIDRAAYDAAGADYRVRPEIRLASSVE